MGANERQVGGTHYEGPYQHWDFVCDVRMHYLPAAGSKYVSRWRGKNGAQDLEKAIHYIEKAKERGITPCVGASGFSVNFFRFCVSQELWMQEAAAIYFMAEANWDMAEEVIRALLTNVDASSSG